MSFNVAENLFHPRPKAKGKVKPDELKVFHRKIFLCQFISICPGFRRPHRIIFFSSRKGKRSFFDEKHNRLFPEK